METAQIITLLQPYAPVPQELGKQLAIYLELLVRWNARTNLTAVRDPEEMVTRHFGESLFAGAVLGDFIPSGAKVLDLGSGAGFPGLPIQLARPDLQVTLAESQNKKASFLREVVRTLGLTTEVHAARAETMPPERLFDVVTMRAVDNPVVAFQAALKRIVEGGVLCLLSSTETATPAGLVSVVAHAMPGKDRSVVQLYRKP
jgi:16S rRNA (guanine527-N7)-methyltransferase